MAPFLQLQCLPEKERFMRHLIAIAIASLLLGSVHAADAACVCDCDLDGAVTVDELLRGVNIALGDISPTDCPQADADGNGQVWINELVTAIDRVLEGCPVEDIEDLDVDDSFDFASTRDVFVDVTVRTANGDAFAGIAVMIFDDSSDTATEATMIHRGITDMNGRFTTVLRIPGHYQALHTIVSAIGIANDAQVPIRGDAAIHVFE
jgi:hypothetical protein